MTTIESIDVPRKNLNEIYSPTAYEPDSREHLRCAVILSVPRKPIDSWNNRELLVTLVRQKGTLLADFP